MTLRFLGRALLSLGRAPRSNMSRFYLACLYGSTSRFEEARRTWGELLEVNPSFSVHHLRRALPYRDPSTLERVTQGLHEAGLTFDSPT